MTVKNRIEVLNQVDDRSTEAARALRASLRELTAKLEGGVPLQEVRDDDSVVTSMACLHGRVSRPTSTVLYVDDEQANRYATKYNLEEDFRVLLASGGKEALDILEREPVDILVTDQRMRGMTGVELCKAVRKKYPRMALVIVSAYFDRAAIIEAVNEAHILYFIPKPWNVERLTALLKDIVAPAREAATG